MDNIHNNTAVSHLLEHNSTLNNDRPTSNFYYGSEKEKTTKEQKPELLNNGLQMPILTPVTNKPEEQNSVKTEDEKNQVKKTKRRKYQGSKQMKKCKTEKNGTEEGEGMGDDHAVTLHVQPVSHGGSYNSSILDEILSEKKRLLLESSEMTEFLKSRIKL